MTNLRIEYVRLDRSGQVLEILGDGETLAVSGTSAQAAAPAFGAVSGAGVMPEVHARLVAVDQAVAVAVGANPTASAADGLRVTPGRPELVRIPEGQRLAAIAAAPAAGLLASSTIIPLTATVPRPDNATQMAVGDIVAGLFTFDFGERGLPQGIILGARLVRQRATTSAERFRLYLFDAEPAQASLTDNTPFPQAWADDESRCGMIDFATPIATLVADAGASLDYEGVRLGAGPIMFGNGGLVRGVLVTQDIFTPTALSNWTLRLTAGA